MQKDKYDHKKWEMLKVALYSFGKRNDIRYDFFMTEQME